MENLAKSIAERIVGCAREKEYLQGEIAMVEELVNFEKQFFQFMLVETRKHLEQKVENSLSGEELVSLFTYVMGKAGEAVALWLNGQEIELSNHGMFDGKIPMYSDDRLMGFLKKTMLASDLAMEFSNWSSEYSEGICSQAIDPILPLFEALKWNWRISCHVVITFLEDQGYSF